MSEVVPLDLLNATLRAALSEQLVALMDRFASKQDIAEFRADFAAHQVDDAGHFREINEKLEQLLTEKDERVGASKERRRFLDSRRFVLTTLVVLIVGLVGAVATLVWLAAG